MLTKTQVIIICLSPFLIFYLFASFVGKQFNPFQWEEVGRLTYIAISTAFAGLCAMFISMECKIKKHD